MGMEAALEALEASPAVSLALPVTVPQIARNTSPGASVTAAGVLLLVR